mgnify:CR=1 FL=1
MTFEETIQRLIEMRKATTTQAAVAGSMGVKQTFVSKFETVKNGTPQTVEKYAQALGYEMSIKLTCEETGEVIE